MIIRTLEFYGYNEQNTFMSAVNSAPVNYHVEVSDKDGNIITIDDDGKLLAQVGLKLENGELSLLDAAHNNSVLATVEFPNAGELVGSPEYRDGVISFGIRTLKGETEKIEIDVEALVDIYEEGQGIYFGDGSEEGKKTINIKLAEGEELLKLDDDGLSISEDIATDEEVKAAIDGVKEILDEKADKEYVDNAISGITFPVDELEQEIENIKDILGTDESSPSINDRLNALSDEVSGLSENVSSLEETVATFNGTICDITDDIAVIKETKLDKTDFASFSSATATRLDALESEDENLWRSLNEEVENRQNADTEEKNRAMAAEAALSGMIQSEIERATAAEEDLASQITAVTGDISTEIADLTDALAQERNERTQADSQLQSLISAETSRATSAEGILSTNFAQLSGNFTVLQSSVNSEIEARRTADESLSGAIATEVSRAKRREDEIEAQISSAVNEEKDRALLAESRLNEKIENEIDRAKRAESAITGSFDDEFAALRRADAQIRQEMHDADQSLRDRIANYEDDLAAEADARISGDTQLKHQLTNLDTELHELLHEERERARDAEDVLNDKIENLVEEEKNRAQGAERDLEDQMISGYSWLSDRVTDNATKINMISELRNCETGVENYDDSGSGILDVLHREFHSFTGSTPVTAIGGMILNPGESTIGRYNISRREIDPQTGSLVPSESTLFTVGYGYNENERANALEVRQDGKLWIMVEGELMCVNDLLAQIAHETY